MRRLFRILSERRVRPAAVSLVVAFLVGCSAPGAGSGASAVEPASAPTQAPMAASVSPGGSPTASTSTTAPTGPSAGPLSVLIDTDLAGDDILAIAVLLRDPAAVVRAITLTGTGEVRCAAGIPNLRRLLTAFGAEDILIACGRETIGPAGRYFPRDWRDAADAMYGLGLPAGDARPAPTDAASLIAKTASAWEPLTVVALGPWTNLADAFASDPALGSRIALVHAMAGAIDVPGNVDDGMTAPADGVEWNLGIDPAADAAVLATKVPIALVPLDATNEVPIPTDIVARLQPDHTAVGADIAFQIFGLNPIYTSGSAYLWDPLAALTLTQPTLATWTDLRITVSTTGRAAGRLVRADDGRPIRVARSADGTRAIAALLQALRRGAPLP